MRFCFVISSVITKHATSKRAFGMAPHLIMGGHDVTICMQDHPDNWEAARRIPGVRVRVYPADLPPLREVNVKQAVMRDGAFDIVHVCGLGWRNFVAPVLSGQAVIVDHVELESALRGPSLARRSLQYGLEWVSLLRCDAAVAASAYLYDLFRSRLRSIRPGLPLGYLPYASDRLDTQAGTETVAAIRRGFDGRKAVLYMGGWYRSYGLFDTIKALREMRSHRRDWVALFLGRGPDGPAAAKMASDCGLADHVRFVGYVPETELPNYLAAVDVFLSPLSDTTADWARCPSKTYMYAMFDKPVVTSRIGENPRALGASGIYYEAGDVAGFARAISSAMDMGAAFKPEIPKAAHSWQTRTGQYLDWIQGWRPFP
jgi:glycosyltransferase involved in cell wall biosynthesis